MCQVGECTTRGAVQVRYDEVSDPEFSNGADSKPVWQADYEDGTCAALQRGTVCTAYQGGTLQEA